MIFFKSNPQQRNLSALIYKNSAQERVAGSAWRGIIEIEGKKRRFVLKENQSSSKKRAN
jgi:hypothetical protein